MRRRVNDFAHAWCPGAAVAREPGGDPGYRGVCTASSGALPPVDAGAYDRACPPTPPEAFMTEIILLPGYGNSGPDHW